MFEIDKQKIGAFIASLRKEKGFTQKELAQQLFISDKAVSKWETGVSIALMVSFLPKMLFAELFIVLLDTLGGIFIPIYVVGKKYLR